MTSGQNLIYTARLRRVANRRLRLLSLLVEDAELERRRSSWVAPELPSGGYQRLYCERVMQADVGADFDFLIGSRGHAVPRPSH